MKGITKNTISNPSYTDAQEWAFAHNAFIGKSGIVNYKENLQVTKVNNNTTRIASGVYCLNGKLIMEENYIDIVHDSGSLGLKRYDLIIAEYVKDGEAAGDDFLGFRVLKGVSASSDPAVPTLTNNDIIEQEILCKIYIEDDVLTIQEMTAALIKNGVDIESLITLINNNITTINTNLGYKFDLGSIGGVRNTQESSTGFIRLNGTNLNSITYTGLYYCEVTPNRPTSSNGWLYVYGGGSNVKQEYHLIGSEAQIIYSRIMINGSWGSWVLVSQSKAVLTGNITLTNGSGTVSGISYPTGFTQSNCYAIVGVDYSISGNPEFGTSSGAWIVRMLSSSMTLVVNPYDKSSTGPSGARSYKIMLIKKD